MRVTYPLFQIDVNIQGNRLENSGFPKLRLLKPVTYVCVKSQYPNLLGKTAQIYAFY